MHTDQLMFLVEVRAARVALEVRFASFHTFRIID
jgi:hypothetical protein